MRKTVSLTKIDSFIDHNYRPIAFDISGVDLEELRKKLKEDLVNHLYELTEDTKYIVIWNCDLQVFTNLKEVHFYMDEDDYDWSIVRLFYSTELCKRFNNVYPNLENWSNDNVWFYYEVLK